MHSKLRAILENAPIKLIAVLLFAILVPSVLVTALGLVAVFQADTFVRDRFSKPLVGKVEEFHARLKQEWAKRLELFVAYLHDAHRRLPQLGELRGRDPWVKDLLLSTKGGLELVLDSPPLELWSPGGSPELKELNRLEVVEKNYPLSLLECRRLLEASRDDAVLVEAHLSAARLSYRLGEREEALRLWRAALDRFGNTVDATGIVRAVPILWRIVEMERELSLPAQVKETAKALQEALLRYERHMDPEVVSFYREKISSLGEAALAPSAAGEASSGRPFLSSSDLPSLESHLPRSGNGAWSGPSMQSHIAVPGKGELDVSSFRTDEGELIVHVLLDRERILPEARLLGAEFGLAGDSLRFYSKTMERPQRSYRGSQSLLTLPLPPPLDNLAMEYIPPEGSLPKAFRGFNVLTLATFTWAVIVLVVTLLVGVLFTLRSVLREMRTARLKSDFVSFISHELKTPLTAIRMFTETILSGRVADEEESRFCIQMIDQESDRLSKLVEQVLEYSQIEQHQKEFRFVSCDMEEVVQEAARIFKDHNRMDPREIEVNAVQHISKIKMDRAAMVELILNLLSNAAKYSPREKKIVVNLRESIDDISVEVIDRGVGIRKRDQRKIFEKFYRADDYLTRDVEGTGLGLTFARYIAKVHNGDIKVSSQVNSGSTFTLQLKKTHVLAE